MSEHGQRKISSELEAIADDHPHVKEHIESHYEISGEYPMVVEDVGDYESSRPNILYEAEAPVYVHIYGDRGHPAEYIALEPTLDGDEQETYDQIRDRILELSINRPAPSEQDEFEDHINVLLDQVVTTGLLSDGPMSFIEDKIKVDNQTYNKLKYQLQRDIVGLGPLQPMMEDPQNEDIHVIGSSETYTDHGTFEMLSTNINFGEPGEFDRWLRNMGERMNTPISDSDPIVDSTLPNGSRINIIYSDDVSVKGPSLTIRQGDEVPLSIMQITKWGTLSPMLSAYLWMCLENERSVFVVGETASGKTTTLNSIFTFIPRDAKIYTAEDTAEVIPPHDTWQQLLTREGSGDEGGDVSMFDLVAAALRSRPDYIIVGEVRGEEAQMAFQAAQTGHPVMLTFHASDIVSMIQRFTSEPINIPEAFMDNCDVALFQNRVKQGDDILRRVTSVQEIEGYSDEAGGVVTREVFEWDPRDDDIVFNGMNNSYVLEEQIATLLGYEDTRDIYKELERRAEIIERLIENDVLGYHEVNSAMETFQNDGVEGLDISQRGLQKNWEN